MGNRWLSGAVCVALCLYGASAPGQEQIQEELGQQGIVLDLPDRNPVSPPALDLTDFAQDGTLLPSIPVEAIEGPSDEVDEIAEPDESDLDNARVPTDRMQQTTSNEPSDPVFEPPAPGIYDPNDVGNDGAFVYRVPIKAPEFRGIAPAISLVYNSQQPGYAANGPLVGAGWSLSGLSSIERVSVGGGLPSFQSDFDIFVLDGQELLACKGHGAQNPYTSNYPEQYTTDSPSNSCNVGDQNTAGKFVAQKDQGLRIDRDFDNGQPYFIVTRPNGVRLRYEAVGVLKKNGNDLGRTNDPAANVIYNRKFLLTEIYDRQQTPNVVQFQYRFDSYANGYAERIHSITYSGYRIRFNYDDPTTHPLRTFGLGHRNFFGRQFHLLKSIEVYRTSAGTPRIRAYKLQHETGLETSLRRLTSVTEFGTDYVLSGNGFNIASGTSYPPYLFEYSEDELLYQRARYTGENFGTGQRVVDRDSDGRAEVIRAFRDGDDLGSNIQFSASRGLSSFSATLKEEDKDGKSQLRTYFVGTPKDGLGADMVSHYWYGSQLGSNNGETRHTYIADVDGNTLLGEIGNDSPPMQVELDRDSGPEFIGVSRLGSLTQAFDTAANLRSVSAIPLSEFNVKGLFDTHPPTAYNPHNLRPPVLADFDGNGLTDYLSRGTSTRPYGVFFARETGFVRKLDDNQPILPSKEGGGIHKPLTGDVNGDGFDDIVLLHYNHYTGRTKILVYLSTGAGFLSADESWAPLHGNGWSVEPGEGVNYSSLADLNNDGRADLIINRGNYGSTSANGGARIEQRSAYVFLSRGHRFRQKTDLIVGKAETDTFRDYLGVADLDGDGMLDAMADNEDSNPSMVYWNYSGVPNRMVDVTTPLGGKLNVSYAPTSEGSGSDAVVLGDKIPGVRQVVAQISISDGRNQTRTTKFRYRDSRFSEKWGKSLGFRTITRVLPPLPGEANETYAVTTFNNTSLARAGMVEKTELFRGNTLWQLSRYRWTTIGTGNGPFVALKTKEWTQTKYNDQFVENGTSYLYDQFNFLKQRIDLGATSNGIDSDKSGNVSVRLSYNRDENRFILDRVKAETTFYGETWNDDNDDTTRDGSLSDNWIKRTEYYYDGKTHTDSDQSLVRGNLTRIDDRDFDRVATRIAVQRLTYDEFGNIVSRKDANGNQTTYTYKGPGDHFIDVVQNATDYTSQYLWNFECGQPRAFIDANGKRTNWTFDELCRLSTVKDPDGRLETIHYNNWGNPVEQFVETAVESADENGNPMYTWSTGLPRLRHYQYFDGLGQPIMEVQSGRTFGLENRTYFYREYDVRGRVAWESSPLDPGEFSTQENGIIDYQRLFPHDLEEDAVQDSRKTRYSYDVLGRPNRTTLPDGSYSNFQHLNRYLPINAGQIKGSSANVPYGVLRTRDQSCYDSNDNTVCKQRDVVTDHRGNVIQIRLKDQRGTDLDRDGGELDPGDRVTVFRYDGLNHLIKVTDPLGATYQYTYDTLGNRLTSSDPGLGNWIMEYDKVGNLTLQDDAHGNRTEFTYDGLNRVSSKKTISSTGEVEVTDYSYDEYQAAGQQGSGESNVGRLVSLVINGKHRVQYGYDAMGNLIRERHDVGPASDNVTYTVNHSFFPGGLLQSSTYPVSADRTNPNTKTVEFRYDHGHRLRKVVGLVNDLQYDHWSQLTRTDYSSGAYEERGYGVRRGWLEWINTHDASDTRIYRHRYWRRLSGTIYRHYTTRPESRFEYSYDYSGRLLKADNYSGLSDDQDQTFAYDASGNMQFNSHLGDYEYNGSSPFHAPRCILAGADTECSQVDGLDRFAYDGNGNMTRGLGRKEITYDAENRVVSVTFNGDTTEYVYGADGSRLKRITDVGTAEEKQTLYVAGMEVRQESPPADGIVETIVLYPHGSVRLIEKAQKTNGTWVLAGLETQYLHRDRLGTVSLITDDTGQVVSRRAYQPFGGINSEFPSVGNQADPNNPIREDEGWIGERFDRDAGLQFLNARYYDPALGLFTSPDWFEVTQAGVGTNRFSYAFNDPVNLSDPNGNIVPAMIAIGVTVAAGSVDLLGFEGSSSGAGNSSGSSGGASHSTSTGGLAGLNGGGECPHCYDRPGHFEYSTSANDASTDQPIVKFYAHSNQALSKILEAFMDYNRTPDGRRVIQKIMRTGRIFEIFQMDSPPREGSTGRMFRGGMAPIGDYKAFLEIGPRLLLPNQGASPGVDYEPSLGSTIAHETEHAVFGQTNETLAIEAENRFNKFYDRPIRAPVYGGWSTP